MGIYLKRIYEEPEEGDGLRVLVDRLWPRGISREKAKLDLWMRDLAPSDDLRRWFGHDPDRFEEFRRRFLEELAEHDEELDSLARQGKRGKVSLLYAAKDEHHNNAVVIAEDVRGRISGGSP